MKKVLFSSVCAVALLGTNVYAVENSLSNSLDTFLSQKTELESKIEAKNEDINNKSQALGKLKQEAETNRALITEAMKAIGLADRNKSDKEGKLNEVNSKKTILDKEKLDLDGKKASLDNEIANLKTSITDLESKLAELTTAYDNGQKDLIAKKQSFNTAQSTLDAKKTEVKYTELEKKYHDAIKAVDDFNKMNNETAGDTAKRQELENNQRDAKAKLEVAEKEIAPLTQAKEKAWNDYVDTINILEKNDKDKKVNLAEQTKTQNNLDLKTQELNSVSTQITTNSQKLSEVQTALTTAQQELEQAKKTLEEKKLAKQNQEAKTNELDLAVGKAKQDLLTAQAELDKLNADLKEIQANITNNTEEGKKAKEELMSSGIYTANTQTHANALISLAASHNGDLSNAAPEVKAQAQTLANQIATTILDEKKDDITAEALSTLNVQINNMNKRLGEVRGLNADIGTWFRIYGGRFSNGNNNFNYYSTQIGADKKTSLNNADILAGVLFGYDKINAGVRAKDTSVGAYLSYIHNDGYFADLVLKYIRSSYDSKFVDVKSQNSFLVSAEGGYRFNVNNNFYLEPSLEIITGYIGKYESSLKIFNKFKINVDAHSPLIFKPQIFAGYSVNDFTFRAGVGAVIDTQTKEADLLIGDIIKGVNAKVKSKLGASDRGFVSVGTAYTFSDNLRLNLSVERSFGTKLTNDYEINSTIRYTF